MNFEQIHKDDHQLTLKITIEPSDYVGEFRKKIKDIKDKGSFKGFRQGKTPESFVLRMYGKSTLMEVVSQKVDEAFGEIVKNEKINYITQPLPSEDSGLDVKPNDLTRSYQYSIDLGLAAKVDVKGIDVSDVYTKYEIAIDPKELEDHLQMIAETFGSQEPVDSQIEGKDILKVSATELEGVVPKKDGWMASFDIVMQSVKAEELKKELLTLKKGSTFTANINDITSRPAASIRKDLLGVEEDDSREIGEMFSFVIEEVMRTKPAELTDELVQEKLTTWGMNSLQELKDDFINNRKKVNEADSKAMLYRTILNAIQEQSSVEMSDTFIKRWLREFENMDDAGVEKTFDAFRKEVAWNKIKETLMEKYEVSIMPQEIQMKIKQRARNIMQQYGFYDETFAKQIEEKISKDKNEVYNIIANLEIERIFDKLIGDLKVETVEISAEAFNEKADALFGKPNNLMEDVLVEETGTDEVDFEEVDTEE